MRTAATFWLVLILSLAIDVFAAEAGQNAGATARMYWQVGTGSGETSRNSTAATAQVVVTVRGVRSFKAADVQLRVQGYDGSLPPAWQAQGGGCAEGAAMLQRGGFGGSVLPNLFTFGGAVPNVMQAQAGMFYQNQDQPCIAPDSTGTIWLQAAGASGVSRDSSQEYAVVAFRLDLSGESTGGCRGDLADSSGALGVLITTNFHLPCGAPPSGALLELIDGNGIADFVPVEAGYDSLTWGPQENLDFGSRMQVLRMSPSGGSPGSAFLARVIGTGLRACRSLELRGESGASARAVGLRVRSDTSVTAFLAVPHQWTDSLADVILSTGSQSTTLRHGFTIRRPGLAASAPVQTIVLFRDQYIALPETDSALAVDAVRIHSTAIGTCLSSTPVLSISQPFRAFSRSDTLQIGPKGLPIGDLDLSCLYVITTPTDADRDSLICKLRRLPETVLAERSPHLLRRHLPPNDYGFDAQWDMYNTAWLGGTVGADVNALGAWLIFQGDSSAKVGIADFGVNLAHPDLGGRVTGPPQDSDSWATMIAGIIAATGDNWINVAGLDWHCQARSEQVAPYTQTATANALRQLIAAGVKVINISWGYADTCAFLGETMALAYKNNILLCMAAGSQLVESTYQYPNIYIPGSISVAATDWDGLPPWYAWPWAYVDVSAPGGSNTYNYSADVWSLAADSTGPYDMWSASGTSFSAAHVTGIASLLLGYARAVKHVSLDNDDLKELIIASARDIVGQGATAGWDALTGWGLVNAGDALNLLGGMTLVHAGALGGDTTSGSVDTVTTFYAVPGTPSGTYSVRRYEVRRSVTYPGTWGWVPYVWGRGVATVGFARSGLNFGVGFCEPVPGTITQTGCTLRTYVYRLPTNTYPYYKWIPTAPENVVLGYTVMGESMTGVESGRGEARGWGCWPNPTRAGCTFATGGSVSGPVRLEIFDATGRRVFERSGAGGDAGERRLIWNGRLSAGTKATPGVYLWKVCANGGWSVGKLVILR